MDKKELFEFLRDNLSIHIDEGYSRDYGGRNGLTDYRRFEIELRLTDPETGRDVVISSESFSIDMN